VKLQFDSNTNIDTEQQFMV